jgi:hypothetical protein
MPGIDLLSRKWWRAVGRPVDLDGEHRWLRGPMSTVPTVGAAWLEDAARDAGGRVREPAPDAGLVADMASLDGPGFRADDLQKEVRDFYEHTARWRMEVWTGWNPLLWPGGELVSRMFGRRVQQLALPTRPLEVARGMDSRVEVVEDAEGRQVGAAWLRTLRTTGAFVYSGYYGHRLLPGADRASVHVTFPLESGNVQVFLRPEVRPDGSLVLESPRGSFGEDGAYVVVADGGATYAARVPIHETFHVHVDDERTLRTDHELRLWSATAVRLHYRLDHRQHAATSLIP